VKGNMKKSATASGVVAILELAVSSQLDALVVLSLLKFPVIPILRNNVRTHQWQEINVL
jgi:uncharacterized membrane protein